MTTLDYSTNGRPAGDTVYYLQNYEDLGVSQETFDGKHVITGGHNRPIVLENDGDNVKAHLMGIKRPLVAPEVTVGEGLLTGDVQVAVQRVHKQSQTRGGISPVWPRASDLVTSGDYSWSGMENKQTFGLGSGAHYNVAWKAQMSTLLADTQSELPYGSEAVSQRQLLVNSISFYGYVPAAGDQDDVAPRVRAAIFSGAAGALTQVSPWVTRRGVDLPREEERLSGEGSPKISFVFESPVLLDGTDTTTYWFVIQTLDVSKTLVLFTQELDGGTGRLNYSTTENVATASFTEYSTGDRSFSDHSYSLLNEYFDSDGEIGSDAYSVSDMILGEDSDGVEWIYIAMSPNLNRARLRYYAPSLKIVRFKASAPSAAETIEIDGVGWAKICPDPANNGDIYIAAETPQSSGVVTVPPFQRSVVVYRRNFSTSDNDSDNIYTFSLPQGDTFRMDADYSTQKDRIVAFNPVSGGGGILLFRYTNTSAQHSALVRFNSDFSSAREHKNVTTYADFNDIHSDPNTADLFMGYSKTGGGKGQVHHLTFTQAGGLTAGPTAVSGVSGNDNTEGVVAIDPTSNPTVAYSSSDEGSIEKGTNGTSSWAKTSPSTLSGLTIVGLSVSPADSHFIHALVENDDGDVFPYYTDDAGVTWKKYGDFGMSGSLLVSNKRPIDNLVSHIQPTYFSAQDDECFFARKPVISSRQNQVYKTITESAVAGTSTVGASVGGRAFNYNISEGGGSEFLSVSRNFSVTGTTVSASFKSPGSGLFSSNLFWINNVGTVPLQDGLVRAHALDRVADLNEHAELIGSPFGDWSFRINRRPRVSPPAAALDVVYSAGTPIDEFFVSLSMLVYTAEVLAEESKDIELLHGLDRTFPVGNPELIFKRVSNASLSISTANIINNEPESVAQGGSERFDALAILIRSQSLGTNFWEVAQVDLGDEYVFNERLEALAVKRAVHDGFFDTPGGFESVANVRNGTDERLVFAGQAGFDPFLGIPGSDDYDLIMTEFQLKRAGGDISILPAKLGTISSVDSSTGEITLTSVNEDQWASLQAGDILPIFNESTGSGGFISVSDGFDPDSQPVSGVYTLEYTDFSHVNPSINMSVFSTYGRSSIGTVEGNSSEVSNWHESLYSTKFEDDTSGLIKTHLRGENTILCVAGYFYYVRAYASRARDGWVATLAPAHPSTPTAPAPSDGDAVKSFGPIYERLRARIAIFKDNRGYEVCRAFVGASSTTGHIQPFSDTALSENGVRGSDPGPATSIEYRMRLTCSVKKGDSVVYFNRDAADDYWHQRKIIIDGDDYKLGFIDKVMDYDPDSGALLSPRAVHLSSPWGGETHIDSPCIIASDYSSVSFTGTGLDEPESFSGLTKLNLVPKHKIAVMAPTNGALYVFSEKDEYFRLDVPSFAIPRTGEEFLNFAIEGFVSTQRNIATFTAASSKYAIDNLGSIYLVGPNGIQVFNGNSIKLVPGMRRMFSKFSGASLRRASLAFDACAFPRPMLRLAGLAYEGGDRTEQVGYIPELDTWVSLGGQAKIDALAPCANRDGISSAVFVGGGALGIYGDMDRHVDHTTYTGPLDGQSLTQNGQGSGDALAGFIGSGDITVSDASESIYAINITYVDSALQTTTTGIDVYRKALNAPLNAGEAIQKLEKPVSFQKFNVVTGESEEAQITGIKSVRASNGSYTHTLYVRGALADTSASRYYWVIGARPWSLVVNEITPKSGARAVQIKSIDMDVSPAGTPSTPWWIKLEVFGTRGSNDIDWETPQITRVVAHTRFSQDSRQVIPIQSGFLRSGAVRLTGYSPAGKHQILKRLDIRVEDIE